ncbi:MAG: hypothetical protein RMA76_38395 [Deltaproteobacteria bacterium]|jgi:hypothetical protein
MSNLTDFLSSNDITAEAVIVQSQGMEAYSDADRAKNTARAAARRAKKSYADAETPKVDKYGRGVTKRTMDIALAGSPVSRVARKKIHRAVNAILTTKKKDNVELSALFGDVGARTGKKK